MKQKKKLSVLGWREFIELPELKVHSLKVKVDTGARTSSLHVSEIDLVERKGKEYAVFLIHPKQRSNKPEIKARAEVVEHRKVKSSNGHTSVRPVILTRMKIGSFVRDIEITLVNRDMMGFRMLLGREAIRGDFMVDVAHSYLLSKELKQRSEN